MKTSVIEKMAAAMEVRKSFGQNRQPNRYENSENDGSVRPILDRRYLTELIGFDAAPAVSNILTDVLFTRLLSLRRTRASGFARSWSHSAIVYWLEIGRFRMPRRNTTAPVPKPLNCCTPVTRCSAGRPRRTSTAVLDIVNNERYGMPIAL